MGYIYIQVELSGPILHHKSCTFFAMHLQVEKLHIFQHPQSEVLLKVIKLAFFVSFTYSVQRYLVKVQIARNGRILTSGHKRMWKSDHSGSYQGRSLIVT